MLAAQHQHLRALMVLTTASETKAVVVVRSVQKLSADMKGGFAHRLWRLKVCLPLPDLTWQLSARTAASEC